MMEWEHGMDAGESEGNLRSQKRLHGLPETAACALHPQNGEGGREQKPGPSMQEGAGDSEGCP